MIETSKDSPNLTKPMRRFLDHFGELGPRWGLEDNTSRLHALLYLLNEPLTIEQICDYLEINDDVGQAAVDDLLQWGMLNKHEDHSWSVEGEPWDLLFTALQERQKRELQPAIDMLETCMEEARHDGATSPKINNKIKQLHAFVLDLSALSKQTNKLSSNVMKNLVGVGGKAARLADRILR